MSEPAVTPAADPAADFAAFEARENALAVGETPAAEPAKPEPVAPSVAAEPEPDKSVTPPSPTSKRTERRQLRDQEQINETIRRAVTEATEATERRLRAELGKPAVEAKPEPAAPIVDPKDPEPQESEFDDYRKFVQAVARWEIRQEKREAAAEAEKTKATDAETAQRTQFHERASTWIQRRDAFAAVTPEFEAKAVPYLDTITANTPIGDVLLESEVGPQMALYLATHPEEAQRIDALPPVSALRALGKLEARFDTPTSASATAAGPAAKTVTTAPAPPTTLASRSATPADPAAAALANGDFAAWEEAENRKAVLAKR